MQKRVSFPMSPIISFIGIGLIQAFLMFHLLNVWIALSILFLGCLRLFFLFFTLWNFKITEVNNV